jgi:hypothetical protein
MEIHLCRDNGSVFMEAIRIVLRLELYCYSQNIPLIPFPNMVIDLTFVCSYNTINENTVCRFFSTRS